MKLRWTRRAYEDLDSICEYLAERDPVAALSTLDRIESAVSNLTRHPGIGRKGRVAGTRELVVQSTPYLVVYRHRLDSVELLAIYHGAQLFPVNLEA